MSNVLTDHDLRARLAAKDRQLRESIAINKQLSGRLTVTESERDDAVEAEPFAVVTESGDLLAEFESQMQAINYARRYFAQTREHVRISGCHWNTRQHGGTRRVRRS